MSLSPLVMFRCALRSSSRSALIASPSRAAQGERWLRLPPARSAPASPGPVGRRGAAAGEREAARSLLGGLGLRGDLDGLLRLVPELGERRGGLGLAVLVEHLETGRLVGGAVRLERRHRHDVLLAGDPCHGGLLTSVRMEDSAGARRRSSTARTHLDQVDFWVRTAAAFGSCTRASYRPKPRNPTCR